MVGRYGTGLKTGRSGPKSWDIFFYTRDLPLGALCSGGCGLWGGMVEALAAWVVAPTVTLVLVPWCLVVKQIN